MHIIRGSEARHIGQHEYYRDCMVKKKGLEEDIGNLSIEKRKLDKEKKSPIFQTFADNLLTKIE